MNTIKISELYLNLFTTKNNGWILTWRGIGVTFFCLWIWICVGDLLSGCGDAELLTGTSGGLISSASSEISLFKSKATDLESTDIGSRLCIEKILK